MKFTASLATAAALLVPAQAFVISASSFVGAQQRAGTGATSRPQQVSVRDTLLSWAAGSSRTRPRPLSRSKEASVLFLSLPASECCVCALECRVRKWCCIRGLRRPACSCSIPRVRVVWGCPLPHVIGRWDRPDANDGGCDALGALNLALILSGGGVERFYAGVVHNNRAE